jgi:energy-coupling factor transport system ATP-binding protein
MLHVQDLRVRYENRSKPAVDGLTLRLDLGEFVLLLGDSASGKSTAMQAICGFIPEIIQAQVSGSIAINGRSYDNATEVSGLVSMVQQDPEMQFCTETVEDEVAFGPENFSVPPYEIRAQVDEALASVRASHLLDRRLSTLSGGEKQKVAIASMLAMRPQLLILDEPTSNLDPRAVSEVVDVIDALRRKREMAIVVVEHRPDSFKDIASRVLTMDKGRLTGDCRRGDDRFQELVTRAQPQVYPRRPVREERAVVAANDLTFEIGASRILDGVSFEVGQGSIVALMGENGAGKTTLLKLLTGLLSPESGRMTVFDNQMDASRNPEPWTLGKDVGFVFQNPNHQIFEKTVEREIFFATENFGKPKDDASRSVEDFERREGVRRFVHPHCLSFGQKRRVNIRSASSHGPRLLLLDEPFAGQDAKNAASICQMLSALHDEGKTLIVVTHDPTFAQEFCTHVIFLKKGRSVKTGRIRDVTQEEWESLFVEDRV